MRGLRQTPMSDDKASGASWEMGTLKGHDFRLGQKGNAFDFRGRCDEMEAGKPTSGFSQSPTHKNKSQEKESKGFSSEEFSALNAYGRLLRAKQMEKAAYGLMADAVKEGNAINSRAAMHAYEKAQKVVRQAEIDHHEEQDNLFCR